MHHKKRTATWLPIHSSLMAFLTLRVGSSTMRDDTVPFGATPTKACEAVPTAVHVQRGVRTADLRTQIRSNC